MHCRPLRTSSPRRSPTKHLPILCNKHQNPRGFGVRCLPSAVGETEGDGVPMRSKQSSAAMHCRPLRTSSPRRSPTKHLSILHCRCVSNKRRYEVVAPNYVPRELFLIVRRRHINAVPLSTLECFGARLPYGCPLLAGSPRDNAENAIRAACIFAESND